MQLNEIQYSGVIPVDGYGAGFFRIGGQVLEGAMIVAPDGARQWAGFEDAESLTALAGELSTALRSRLSNEPAPDRTRRLISTILMPDVRSE